MIKKKYKNAQGHVEIIFSFVIFISFLSFLLISFNPFKTTSNTETYLYLAQTQIEKLITKEISLLTLNLNNPKSTCGYFDYEDTGEEDIITKNSSGYIYNSTRGTGGTQIYIGFSPSNNFYLIYFSDDFKEKSISTTTCSLLPTTNYTLGLLRTYSVVSFKEINETFSNSYTLDRANLKKKIGIPETKDFSLNFYDLTRTSIKELGTPPEKTVIYAREIPVQFMYPDGKFEYGFMQIKIW